MIVIGESVRAVRVIGEGEGEVRGDWGDTPDQGCLLSPLSSLPRPLQRVHL